MVTFRGKKVSYEGTFPEGKRIYLYASSKEVGDLGERDKISDMSWRAIKLVNISMGDSDIVHTHDDLWAPILRAI